MIRVFILIPLLFIVSFTAEAQFQWLKKKQPAIVRYPELPSARSIAPNFSVLNTVSHPIIKADVDFGMTVYCFETTETALLKALYHTLRFHMDVESIKNYYNLIDLYISQNHYSEAKWHLLQCNVLAQKINNTDGIIYALTNLATVKAGLGEFDQAHDDLMEARNISAYLMRLNDVAQIDKKLSLLKLKQSLNLKNENRYAEVVEDKKTAQ